MHCMYTRMSDGVIPMCRLVSHSYLKSVFPCRRLPVSCTHSQTHMCTCSQKRRQRTSGAVRSAPTTVVLANLERNRGAKIGAPSHDIDREFTPSLTRPDLAPTPCTSRIQYSQDRYGGTLLESDKDSKSPIPRPIVLASGRVPWPPSGPAADTKPCTQVQHILVVWYTA